MDTKIIKETIESLELFLHDTSKKLNKSEKEQLAFIIERLYANLDVPDKKEIWQLMLVLFKIMAEGADIFKHFL